MSFDDWTDVKTEREEALLLELASVKSELQRRTAELDACHAHRRQEQNAAVHQITETNKLMEGLEAKIRALQNDVDERDQKLVQSAKTLEDSYAWNQTLQSELDELKLSFEDLERQKDQVHDEVATVKKEAADRSKRNMQVVNRTQSDLNEARSKLESLIKEVRALQEHKSSLERVAKDQRAMLEESNRKIKAGDERQRLQMKQLAAATKELQNRASEVSGAFDKVKTLEALVGQLKADKLAMQQVVDQQSKDILEASKAKQEEQATASVQTNDEAVQTDKHEDTIAIQELREQLASSQEELT